MAKSFNKYQLEVRAQNLNIKATDVEHTGDSEIYPVISKPLKISENEVKPASNDNKKDK